MAETLTSKLGLPPSGVCRFCGCDNEHACVVPGATLQRCSWLDRRLTCCTAPVCALKAGDLMDEAMLVRALVTCICGHAKTSGRLVCWHCWNELPWSYQGYLFDDVGAGLGLYYADAIAYLKAHTARLSGGR